MEKCKEQFDSFVESLRPGAQVVDLGAGDGRFSARLRAAGMRVIAVDRHEPPSRQEGIEWHVADVGEWLEEAGREVRADAVFARNILQFIPAAMVRDRIIPAVRRMVLPGGVLSLTSFYDAPVPAFRRRHRSYWTTGDLLDLCEGMKPFFVRQEERETNDLEGIPRIFRISEVIVRH